MKKGQIIISIICSILLLILIVCLPIFMDKYIIGNSYPSNISNENWVTFFGSYFGGIIGALVSMCGIILTIHFSLKQNKEDHVLQVRPYITYCYYSMSQPGIHTFLGKIELETDIFPGNSISSERGFIVIKNIGLGPATRISVGFSENNKEAKIINGNSSLNDDSINNSKNALQVNGEAGFQFSLLTRYDDITPDSFDAAGKSIKVEVKNKYNPINIEFVCSYYDLFNNHYLQPFTISCYGTPSYDSKLKEGKIKFKFELQNVQLPRKQASSSKCVAWWRNHFSAHK